MIKEGALYFPAENVQTIDSEIEEKLLKLDRLPLVDRANVLLVAKGLKPASILEMYYLQEEAPDMKADQHATQHILFRLGLPYFSRNQLYENNLTSLVFYIGKDVSHRKKLMDALATRDGKKVGLALGYPETAARHNAYHTRVAPESLPAEVRASEAMKFVPFTPSQTNWRDELQIGARNAAVIKEIAPRLYHQVVSGNHI